jgi:transcriptional regulator with XRE-family HTH domain
MAPTVGEVVAQRVERYRREQGLTQQDVAARTEALGHSIGRATVAKIESGGTRAANVSLADVLVLAVALDVPPPLLFLPLGDSQEVAIAPKLVAHPHIALDWLAGENSIAALPDNFSRNVEAWFRNAWPITMFRGLRARQNATGHAEAIAKGYEQQGDKARMTEARQAFDRALVALDTWLQAMVEGGLGVPEMPEPWQHRMAELRQEAERGVD